MISKPNLTISLASANNVLDIGLRRDLIVCQTDAAATAGAAANELITDVHLNTKAQLDTLFVAGSYCRIMVQQWLDANREGNNVGAALDVIALLEGSGATAGSAIITIVGTATVADTFEVTILSSELYKETITVAVGDTATDVADAITAAFPVSGIPFTVANTSGVVTITATDLGTIGNDYGVEISKVAGGLTSVVVVASGSTGTVPPTVTNLFDLVGDTVRYQGILWPSDLAGSIDVPGDFLDSRFNVSNDILDGVAFMGESNTLAASKVVVNALNSESLVVMGNSLTGSDTLKAGPEVVHPVDWTAATFMGIRARRLTNNASISSVVTANASGDQFGGKALASLPYFNTPLASVPVTNSVNLFSGIEQTELNVAGYSVVGPNKPTTETIMGTVVTTYKTDSAGNADVSFKYLNYVDTASVCREFLFNNMKASFAQSRLTDGDLLANRSMENAASIEATFRRFLALLKNEALVRKGRVADGLIDASLTVTLDLANRQATINSVLPIVTQLETINVTLQLSFDLG